MHDKDVMHRDLKTENIMLSFVFNYIYIRIK